jgi:uncharacterized protein (DUF58 family)
MAQLPAGARAVLLSDFFAEPQAINDAVLRYASGGAKGALMQIVDSAEEEFPFQGRTEFHDLESRDRLVFGETGTVGMRYRARFAAHREALAEIARRFGWTFLVHRTDRPVESALLALFMALSDFRALK